MELLLVMRASAATAEGFSAFADLLQDRINGVSRTEKMPSTPKSPEELKAMMGYG